jgi:hypothetical protein
MIASYYYWEPQFSKKEILLINKHIQNNFDQIEDVKLGAHSEKGKPLKNVNVTQLIRWHKIKHLVNKVYGFADYVLTHEYTYQNKNDYKWHVDQSHSDNNFDIKGTLLINISEDEYEGGDFEIFHQGIKKVVEFSKPGSMVLFHGFMNHRVTPVTKGTRKTLAMFITGPTWR